MSRSADLDGLCIAHLKPVRFGAYSTHGRIVSTIETQLAAGREITVRQRLALYAICWRYREQIADSKFTARVLIVERLLVEGAEVTELLDTNVTIRAWRGTAPAAERELFADGRG